MQFGINNTIIPPAPEVNDVDFNTIVVVGLAPKGPKQTLVVCANDTDDSQFGLCLTGFPIPRALDTIRRSGGGKVVVINVFDPVAHVSAVVNENATVNSQKTATAFNPTNDVEVKNTPVSYVAAVAATTTTTCTTGSGSGDTIDSLMVGLVNLLATPLVLGSNNTGATASALAVAINANTGSSGFTASATGSILTISGSTDMGASINGVVPVFGTITGAVVFGAIGAMGSVVAGVTGVTAVPAVTYVKDTDYSIDDYGKIRFLIAVADGSVVRLSYNKLNASAVNDATIIGTVSGSTRTGCKLVDSCKTVLGLVPKILIIPFYNTSVTVQAEMERLASKYRMRYFEGAISGLTLAQAIASRGPGGTLPTFNLSSKRAILAFPQVLTYDPQSASLTLDDPSALFAGFLSWNAAINGPQVSTSNQVMPACGGSEINLLHDWEDPNSAGQTNQLRSSGIACVFSDGGFKWWGAENASFPDNSAVDLNICAIYVNDIITDALTAFATQYIDKNITSGSISSFVTAANNYYSSLMVKGWIGKSSNVQFLKARNSDAELAAGKIRFTRNTFYYVGMKLIELEENMTVQIPTV